MRMLYTDQIILFPINALVKMSLAWIFRYMTSINLEKKKSTNDLEASNIHQNDVLMENSVHSLETPLDSKFFNKETLKLPLRNTMIFPSKLWSKFFKAQFTKTRETLS